MQNKLAVLADLHLDSNQFDPDDFLILKDLLHQKEVTHLHLAGDMSNDFTGVTQGFLTDFSQEFDVSYNLGNHDMLGMHEETIEALDFQIKQIGQTQLLSFHGWYDYSFYSENPSKILHFKNNFYFDRKLNRALPDVETTDKIIKQLERVLSNLTDPLLVVLHFVPHQNFTINTRYGKFQRFNAYLGAQRFHQLFVKHQIKNVVFGHIHHRRTPSVIDGITYHSRPLGYSYEWEMIQELARQKQIFERNPRRAYNLLKHNQDWQTYRRAHLKAEFESALVFFDDL